MSMQPEYQVYVISKGRWESRVTVRTLQRMGMDFVVVVEPQEFDLYASVIPKEQILVLPFSNLGLGSIPARNWVWEDSISKGHKRHWILDDNIEMFYRLHNNMKSEALTGAIFRAAEHFVDRYSNVAIAGFNYATFCKKTCEIPPYYLNTRIYSCILIDNSIPYRWRGRYNEDTDLSLNALKGGYCTVLFNAFLAGKVTTMRMKGGNTDELYADDGRKKMAEALQEAHPDVATVTWKFNRWHHQVDYSSFKKNKLKKIDPSIVYPEVNNFGMVLKDFSNSDCVSS